jgi:hypothetical protein
MGIGMGIGMGMAKRREGKGSERGKLIQKKMQCEISKR